MSAKLRVVVLSAAALTVACLPAFAQTPIQTASQNRSVSQVRSFSPHEVEALLAPIALFPDALLAQMLMATTYPSDIEAAADWVADPAHANLTNAALVEALDHVEWDPSLKALVTAPAVLRVLDSNRDWSDLVGTAFTANWVLVMDAVQTLRRQALKTGHLASDNDRNVTDRDGQIIIEPASRSEIHVEFYEPVVALGGGTAAGYAPYRFLQTYYKVAIQTYAPLWDWTIWDWGGRTLRFDAGVWRQLNHNRPPLIAGNIWYHKGYNGPVAEVAQATPVNVTPEAISPLALSIMLSAPPSTPEPPPYILAAPADDYRSRDHDHYRDHDRREDRESRQPPPKPDSRAEAARAILEMSESVTRQAEVMRKPLSDFMPQRPPYDPQHVPMAGEISPGFQQFVDTVEAARRQSEAVAAAGRRPPH